MIRVKRIYEQPSMEDGYRVLVDRLWPRGISKDRARIDLWLKEIAPSDGLRKWFGHDPKKWDDFKKKYQLELRKKPELVLEIKRAEKEKGTVTFLYSAKDEKHNQAVALSAILHETDIDEPDEGSGSLKYMIEIDRDGCIACATCYTLDSKHFESDAEGKSKVVGGQSNGKSSGSFEDKSIDKAQVAESSCPVSVIKVTKTEQ